jgi:hypothetical protein
VPITTTLDEALRGIGRIRAGYVVCRPDGSPLTVGLVNAAITASAGRPGSRSAAGTCSGITPSPGLSRGGTRALRSTVGRATWDGDAARHYQSLFRKSKSRSPGR